MIPAVQNLTGSSLNTIIATHTKASDAQVVYGPRTIALMTAMGYTRLGSDRLSSVVINPNAQSDPIINGAGRRMMDVFALGLLLFLM